MADLNRPRLRFDTSRFAMTPRADIPRSTFVTTHGVKDTFNAGDLVPIHVDEVLPGDVHQGNITIFARLSPLLFPLMDNIELETFAFFVPMRLVWSNATKFFGERINPGDSISYTIPVLASAANGFPAHSIYDHFGIPPVGQLTAGGITNINVLPLRAYNLIYREWFRDQDLTTAPLVELGDTGDTVAHYALKKRSKRPDYFTTARPWPTKAGVETNYLSGKAPVRGIGLDDDFAPTAGNPPDSFEVGGAAPGTFEGNWTGHAFPAAASSFVIRTASASAGTQGPHIYADLASTTGATINALRLAFATHRLLERDARSGTRYTEILRAHYGVIPEDMRLQRPEYIGGGRTSFQTQAIPQTSATGLTGGTTPAGSLVGQSTVADQHSYTYRATEHGYIIVLANVRGEVTYQQGLHKLWNRRTRYDVYWPVFAHLGEQAILNNEIWHRGNTSLGDDLVFGYQERWAEYRHRPSRLAGMFRSTTASNIDDWHLAEQFATLPVLNATFIQDPTEATLRRALAAAAAADNQQVLFDSVFKIRTTRCMPMYSVPGMIDRF